MGSRIFHWYELASGACTYCPASGNPDCSAAALQLLYFSGKDTSLAAAITVPELFQSAQRIVATTYEPLILYIEAALIYLVMSSVLSALQVRLERRFGRYGGTLETNA